MRTHISADQAVMKTLDSFDWFPLLVLVSAGQLANASIKAPSCLCP